MISLDHLSKIGVLDINHGALAIAGKLAEAGFDAFAVDVYGTKKLPESDVPVYAIDDAIDYDALIAPVHLPKNRLTSEAERLGRPVYSHHDAVGYLVGRAGLPAGTKAIEVTGTVGKTTACFALAKILAAAGEKVMLHTSSGLYYEGKIIEKGLSIAPASALAALDRSRKLGATAGIFEVSLGVCGFGQAIALTSLERDYPIAGGARMASLAKLESIARAGGENKLVCPAGTATGSRAPVCTFGPGGTIAYDAAGNIRYGADRAMTLTLDLRPALDLDAYRKPILCAAAIAQVLGIRPEHTAQALADFDGVEGRMKLGSLQGRILVDNSNSGLAYEDVAAAVSMAGGRGGRRVLLLGEESYNVCSGLDPEGSLDIIAHGGLDDVVLVGRRMRKFAGQYRWAKNLAEGMEAALALTAPGDTIVSCVKAWR